MTDYSDPLAIPAGTLEEPKYPVLSEGLKTMKVVSFEVGASDDGSNKRLQVKLELTKTDVDRDGQTLHPGYVFTESLFLTPNDKNSAKEIAERVAMVIKAALGKGTTTSAAECIANPSLITNKLVDVVVGIRKGKEEGQFFNNVKKWMVAA